MYKFNPNIKIFNIKEIDMIGNLNNGILIGLNADGKKLVDNIINNQTINLKVLNENQSALFKALEQNGFFESKCDENTITKSAYIHINSKCNLHCKGCYSFVEERNAQDELSLEQWFEIIAQLDEYGISNIIISGGEPLLRNDLPQICKYMRDVGIKNIGLISNGTMPQLKYDAIIPYIDNISISVDGYNETTTFIRDSQIMPQVLDCVRQLKQKINTSIIVTLHKKNIEYMIDYHNLAKNLGVFMNFSIYSVDVSNSESEGFLFDEMDFLKIGKTVSNSSEHLPILDTPNEKIGISCTVGCGFGRLLISVGYNGNIYPCHMLHNENCIMGNILCTPLNAILDNPQFCISNISVEKINECNKCEYKFVCGGGCRGRSFLKYKDFNHKDPYCIAAKTFFENLFEKLATNAGR